MSLDVYLIGENRLGKFETGIYVRRNGQSVELTVEEAKELYPDWKPDGRISYYDTNYDFDANITHNLGIMASKAGIYYALWRPEEIGLVYAKDLIPYLTKGLARLRSAPDKYKKYNPENGWGSYEVLVKVVKDYLIACIEHPDSAIEVSR